MALETVVSGIDSIARDARNSGFSPSNILGVGIPLWVIGGVGSLFGILVAMYGWQSLDALNMGAAQATTVFAGASAVGGFLSQGAASTKLDSLGRDVHIAEIVPAVAASGLTAYLSVALLLPPDPVIPWNRGLDRVIDLPQ